MGGWEFLDCRSLTGIISKFADVAELADAQASGACGLYARGGSTPLIRIFNSAQAFVGSFSCFTEITNLLCTVLVCL